MGVDPERLARQLTESGQLGQVASEVLRGKAMDIIAMRAKVTDEAGNEVAIEPPAIEASAAEDSADDQAGDEAAGGDEES
jgi:trigger factor